MTGRINTWYKASHTSLSVGQ